MGIEKRKVKNALKNLAQGAAFVGTVLGGLEAAELSQRQDSLTEKLLSAISAEKGQMPRAEYEEAVLKVALLARSFEPQYDEFDKDPALDTMKGVDRRQVIPLVRHAQVDSAFWTELASDFKAVDARNKTHTAKAKLELLKQESQDYGGVDPIELEQSAAAVGRNLFMRGEEPTPAAVAKEVNAIRHARESIAREDLFKHDVVLVSGDETWDRGEENRRFAPQELQDAIKARQKRTPTLLAFANVDPYVADAAPFFSTQESRKNAKSDALQWIASNLRPLTVMFDGHGSGASFYFGGDETIDVAEMADSLAKRWKAERAAGNKDLQISLVFDDCLMQRFVRDLSLDLGRRGVPLPNVMITASEFGQFSYGNPTIPFGSTFSELVVNSPDLDAVMGHKRTVRGSDPAVFVPRKEDPKTLMQVSGVVMASFPAVG